MAWDWAVYGAGIATASLAWAVAWAIYTRKTEARQAITTAKEIERTKRESEGLRELRSGALNVIQMADNLLRTFAESPANVSTSQVAIKMTGRLKGLREPWSRFERDIRDGSVIQGYERLRMDQTFKWFDGDPPGTGSTHASIEEAIGRVEEVRGLAADLLNRVEAALST